MLVLLDATVRDAREVVAAIVAPEQVRHVLGLGRYVELLIASDGARAHGIRNEAELLDSVGAAALVAIGAGSMIEVRVLVADELRERVLSRVYDLMVAAGPEEGAAG
jgi:hypothetical protein